MMPSHNVRIFVATQPLDFRKGHDGLAALTQSVLKEDPFTGAVFVFRAERADRLKMMLNRARFEALFACLDWRKVRALEAAAE